MVGGELISISGHLFWAEFSLRSVCLKTAGNVVIGLGWLSVYRGVQS